MTDGPEGDSLRDAREQGAARAVLRRRRADLSRAISEALEQVRQADRPHDCTIEVRGAGVLRLLPARRLTGWSLGTVQAGTGRLSRLPAANFALGSDGRLYWNASPSESRGVDGEGRFATTGTFAARRLRDDAEALDGVIALLRSSQRPSAEPG